MIYMDIYVPAISDKVEVRADENKTIAEFKEELCSLLKKMMGEAESGPEGYELYSDTRGELLPDEYTLSECGLSGGSRLILV